MNVNTVFDNLTNNYLRFVLAEQRYFGIRDEATNHQRKKKANDKITHNAIIFEHEYFLIDITHSKKNFFSLVFNHECIVW